jgi:spoIIIJ-associated protein
MSSERSIETTGETVEDAIAQGLAELGGVSPSDVIVEVLEEPSRGMFGLGARPARVRLKMFRAPPETAPAVPQVTETTEFSKALDDSFADSDESENITFLEDLKEYADEKDMDEDARIGKVVLAELLERMSILRAVIVIRRAVAPKEGENNPWLLDITGSDLSPLIGRRGETLNALQYITRLIASRELQHRANLVVDAAGYKSRRMRMLRDLALRMAEQATRTNRTVALEPMPPYERRIVHMALRSHPDVQTRSIGEGTSRKVTIIPK